MNTDPKTLYSKIWTEHEVCRLDDGRSLLYIDRHLVHEVTSPQAFSGLSLGGREIARPSSILAVPDHNVPTDNRARPFMDGVAERQLAELEKNCRVHKLDLIPLNDTRQGIVHVIGPELGFSQPGLTLVCGDSHTSTHGALGALAFGIGTSDVEHVLATQCMKLSRLKNMHVHVSGSTGTGISAKDVILHIAGLVGVKGGVGHCIEYSGQAIAEMDIEQRMTVCNMSIEMGARAGLVAVDDKTIEYLRNRPLAPQGSLWDEACRHWRTLRSDAGAVYDKTVSVNAEAIEPMVTWGTTPEMSAPIGGRVPNPDGADNPEARTNMYHALEYMGLEPDTPMSDIVPEFVFIGSCTNGRLSDLRAAAAVAKGRKVSPAIQRALVVPGSGQVRAQAEAEGLDRIFIEAGFEWRHPGCSMCLGMNLDRLSPQQRCASTSNRNFEGRQGRGSRTHLMSPAMAAAAAVSGHLTDVREMKRADI
ncbi:MAG: 3-isopropylmalate dehydratase large subunit [Gammaproteobacteria bacterium]|nr:3-isopropylmalate dehydratase large subunit [Pseudomonadota bacterium]MCH9663801.1 3-isopropylmalate dehydratase large subunit [Gammaproteobacteria bacterium]